MFGFKINLKLKNSISKKSYKLQLLHLWNRFDQNWFFKSNLKNDKVKMIFFLTLTQWVLIYHQSKIIDVLSVEIY